MKRIFSFCFIVVVLLNSCRKNENNSSLREMKKENVVKEVQAETGIMKLGDKNEKNIEPYFIGKEWINTSGSVFFENQNYKYEIIVEFLPTKITLSSEKDRNNIFEIQFEPRLWSEGYLKLYNPSINNYGIILESLGIVEVYKFDISKQGCVELWNPEYNAGVYVFFVDWDNEIIFTTNTNTDKGLAKDFKYEIKMFSNKNHSIKEIDSSIGERIKIISQENGKIVYQKMIDGLTKDITFLY